MQEAKPWPVELPLPWKLGDHLALNLLNTEWIADETLHDSFQSDQDVVNWLAGMRLLGYEITIPADRQGLLRAALALRAIARNLIENQHAGKESDLTPLNEFLREGISYLQLSRRADGTLQSTRCWLRAAPRQLLATVAEATATLLASEDAAWVRQCESDRCVLWFLDQTRSHHRRWCSMATCGNRHKAATFRKRKLAASE